MADEQRREGTGEQSRVVEGAEEAGDPTEPQPVPAEDAAQD